MRRPNDSRWRAQHNESSTRSSPETDSGFCADIQILIATDLDGAKYSDRRSRGWEHGRREETPDFMPKQ